MRVELGNHAPLDNGRALPHWSVTTVEIPVGVDQQEGFRAITDRGDVGNGVWVSHSNDPAPAWVSVTNGPSETAEDAEALEERLANHYQCERGVPEDVEERYYTLTPPGVYPPGHPKAQSPEG